MEEIYCQIHPADVLYFNRKIKSLFYCLTPFKPSKYSLWLAVVCCWLFSSIINGILLIFHFARVVTCHHTVNKEVESNHLKFFFCFKWLFVRHESLHQLVFSPST